MRRFRPKFEYNLIGAPSASEFSESMTAITPPTALPTGELRIHRIIPDPNSWAGERPAKRYQIWIGMDGNTPAPLPCSAIIPGDSENNSNIKFNLPIFEGGFAGSANANNGTMTIRGDYIVTTLNNMWYGSMLPYA